jgi:hypothetical protein
MTVEGVESIIAALDWADDLSSRVVAVIYGYFDDSGTDAESPVAIMAGYVAHASDWKKFENKTKRLFEREAIPFFRAKLFDHQQKQFKGWTPARQMRFAEQWYGYAKAHLMRGAAAGVLKSDLTAAKAKHRKLPGISAQASCAQIALAHLCRDGEVWAEIERYGLSLIIESSTVADAGIREDLARVVAANKLEKFLHSITFAKKSSARALQIADYLAYYSHRFALTAIHGSLDGVTPFLDIAKDRVPTIMKLAHSFKPNAEFQAAWWASKRKPS